MFINLQSLKYFEVVARTQHFTKASQELYVSQSTLSKSIDALEKELGLPLFEKKGRNVQLTKYGVILRDYVQKSFNNIDTGIQLIRSLSGSETGSIYIASIFTMGANYFPSIISSYTQAHPNVQINYHQKATEAILDEVLSGQLDLGFTGEFPSSNEYSELNKEVVLSEELNLIVPEGHPLSGRESVAFEEIAGETFIGWNKDTGIYRSINQVLEQSGRSTDLNYTFWVTEDSTLVGFVRQGLGLGLIPNTPTINLSGVKSIKISQPYFYRNLYMVWHKDRFLSPAAHCFKKFILSH